MHLLALIALCASAADREGSDIFALLQHFERDYSPLPGRAITASSGSSSTSLGLRDGAISSFSLPSSDDCLMAPSFELPPIERNKTPDVEIHLAGLPTPPQTTLLAHVAQLHTLNAEQPAQVYTRECQAPGCGKSFSGSDKRRVRNQYNQHIKRYHRVERDAFGNLCHMGYAFTKNDDDQTYQCICPLCERFSGIKKQLHIMKYWIEDHKRYCGGGTGAERTKRVRPPKNPDRTENA